MALYGSVDGIKRLLRSVDGSVFGADAEARIAILRSVASSWLEHEIGRTFGAGGGGSQTLTVSTNPDAAGLYTLLLLPKGARSITQVVERPTWNGSAWTGGLALAGNVWRLDLIQQTGEALALRRIDGIGWYGTYRVAGTWEDAGASVDGSGTVPAEIDYAANYVAAELFKKEQASPAGQIGPDGAILPLRDVLQDPLVQAIVTKWKASESAVIV